MLETRQSGAGHDYKPIRVISNGAVAALCATVLAAGRVASPASKAHLLGSSSGALLMAVAPFVHNNRSVKVTAVVVNCAGSVAAKIFPPAPARTLATDDHFWTGTRYSRHGHEYTLLGLMPGVAATVGAAVTVLRPSTRPPHRISGASFLVGSMLDVAAPFMRRPTVFRAAAPVVSSAGAIYREAVTA